MQIRPIRWLVFGLCTTIPLISGTALAQQYGGGGYNNGDYYGCNVEAPDPDALLWSSNGGNPLYDFCCGRGTCQRIRDTRYLNPMSYVTLAGYQVG